ncbi:MAG TPA: response regulator transcription factor, partial [Gaiellaceae bacterium]|nr:response regulator transcription factor [Gaiellaceae bacterium]
MAIKVLLADDHRLILAGIRRALEEVEDLEVVGEAESGSQVLPLIHQTSPDLVLLDLRLPDMSGLACLDAIRQRYP